MTSLPQLPHTARSAANIWNVNRNNSGAERPIFALRTLLIGLGAFSLLNHSTHVAVFHRSKILVLGHDAHQKHERLHTVQKNEALLHEMHIS